MKWILLFLAVTLNMTFCLAQRLRVYSTIENGCQNTLSTITIDSVEGVNVDDLDLSWYSNEQFYAEGRNFAYAFVDTTVHEVMLLLRDKAGHISQREVFEISAKPVPTFDVLISESCPLSVTYLSIQNVSITNVSVSWTGDGDFWNTSGPVSNPQFSSPSWIFFSDLGFGHGVGNFPITITVNDGNCSTIKYDTVRIFSPTVEFNDTNYFRMPTDTISLSANNIGPIQYILWVLNDGQGEQRFTDLHKFPLDGLISNKEYTITASVEGYTGCAAMTKPYRFMLNSTGFDPESLTQLKVYPNPIVNNVFFSEVEENSIINIWSTDGKLLATRKLFENSIDVQDLETGFYILQYKNQYAKVIKQSDK
jgi:hypothetical protein